MEPQPMFEYEYITTDSPIETRDALSAFAYTGWRVHTFTPLGTMRASILFERLV